MEFLKQLITRILGSGLLSTALVLVRAVTVLMVLYVIWRCYTSFKKGQRRKDPVVMLARISPFCTGKIPLGAAAAAIFKYPIIPFRATMPF